ncbi:cytochrome c-type biogenesis protein CcmH [Methylopila capsulata]|uniref:Cytochrome c-type biogenesis protein n=2 Tax=Methylopila capsulata TaxID=61654 RepID=A0ABS2T7C8_9HYPH|nr:cytochrome c-type biogenesis protein CcmH [Methylopila capsulata]
MRKTIPALRCAAAGMTALVLALSLSPAVAVQPGEELADPALESRARALSYELRCMVCQNQSIDDSDAQLAKDLRLLVRERIKGGDSDAQVLDFLVDRYGQFVLLKPRFRTDTALLWLFAPGVLVVGLAGYLVWALRSRRRDAPADALTADERARLEVLLAEDRDASRTV